MSANTPPIFKPDANATLVRDIRAPKPDPRAARVHRVHQEILAAQKKPGRGLNG